VSLAVTAATVPFAPAVSRPPALTTVRLRLPVARAERAVLALVHAALGAALGRWLADALRHGPFEWSAPVVQGLEAAWPLLPALSTVAGLWIGLRQSRVLLPPTDDGAWLMRDADGQWSLVPEAAVGSCTASPLVGLRPAWDLGAALLLQTADPLRWLWLRRGAAGEGPWHALRLALREPVPAAATSMAPGGERR
jgi:hypothetical protein